MTLTVTGNASTAAGIRDTAAATPLGFQTSSTGAKWLQMFPAPNAAATAVFTFATAVDAFGLFITDSEAGFPGNITLAFNDGTAQALGVTKGANGGGELFFGFSDLGKSFNTVTISTGLTGATRDIWGMDDIRFSPAAAVPVPEPTTLALVGAALLGMVAARRRKL